MSIAAGTRLGRFEVLSRLGAGGMGEVYLARDTHLGRSVALKVLAPGVAADEDRIGRFRLEAVAASALNHPNILTIYDVGEADGLRYITTEFVDGETLREYLARPRDLRQILEVFIQLCSALDAAHAAGIVHRDLKPENVMVRRDGYVKVLDFGLAKLTDHSDDSMAEASSFVMTLPGMVVGTVSYMSPEQAQAQPVDARADVWSIGVMLYEAVSGRVPFRGESPVVVFAGIIRRDPQPLSEAAIGTPDELDRIVMKALRKDRSERYQTVGELLTDLRSLRWGVALSSGSHIAAPRGDADATTVVPGEWGPLEGITRALASSVPAPKRPTNLSGAVTPLIGREIEVSEVAEMLGRDDVRLVTLTGAGGSGKTRLAQQVGRELLERFDDGVFFVDLSPIADPALVASTTAAALEIRERATVPAADALVEHLAGKQLLLIADNFEQVAGAGTLLADLLRAAPRLKVLVTSRARLHLRAEREYEVPPLEVPPREGDVDVERLRAVPAVRLFVERAAAARPGFELTAANAADVAEICRRLDGLPLAIELAAARSRLLAPPAMLPRLRKRLKLLTGGAVDLPERQRTMRAAVAWSYDLLGDEEKAVFRCLSVFAGGCTLEAAEAVCGGETDVVDALGSLADKSLVRQRDVAGGETRFRMFEVVRELGLEALEERGELEAASRAHAEYFLALAGRASPELTGPDPSAWLELLEREHANIRAALEWLFANTEESGPRLASLLSRFWAARSHYAEGRRWLEEALERTEGRRTVLRAKLLTSYGHVVQMQRDRQVSLPRFEESLEIARELGDPMLVAAASVGVGIASTDFGDFARARERYEEVLAISRALGDSRLAFHALNNLGEVARGEGDYGAARAYYEEALAHEKTDSNEWAGNAHVNLGAVSYYQREYGEMAGHFEKSLDAFRRTGDHLGVATALSGFGAHAAATGDAARAARLAGAVESICESLGTRLDISDEVLFDEWRQLARRALGDAAYEAAEGEGRRMTADDASRYALGGEA